MFASPVFALPADYLKIGVFSDEQLSFFNNCVAGTNSESCIDEVHAKEFENEFQTKPGFCDSWFMDTFLRLLEKCSPEIGTFSCMLSQTYEGSMAVSQRNRIQTSACNKFTSEKFVTKRFIVSFFNIMTHWYWYIYDQTQRVVFFGDAFNNYTSLSVGGGVAPGILRRLFDDFQTLVKLETGNYNADYKFQAVECPRQATGDGTSCGQLACASVISFLSRVYHERIPVYQYSSPIQGYEGQNALFIKQRLVMSFAYGNFLQPLKLLTYNSDKIIELDSDANSSSEQIVQIGYAAIDFQFPDLSLLPDLTPPPQAKKELRNVFDEIFSNDDIISTIADIDPSYFPQLEAPGQIKVFVDCHLNPEWQFATILELLVACSAVLSNVNKKGTEKIAKSRRATTEMLISTADLVWHHTRGSFLGWDVYQKELSRTHTNSDGTTVPNSKRSLVYVKDIWRVTQLGYDNYLKYKSQNQPGPCTFKEVQSMKGRKSKSFVEKQNSSKSATKLLTDYSPYENKEKASRTWIKRIKPILEQTHCPHSLDTIVKSMTSAEEKEKVCSIRQGIIHGCKKMRSRAAKFYKFEVMVGKKPKLFCGLIENQRYEKQIPQNVSIDENGNECIIWREFIPGVPITGCLSIPVEYHRRVFSITDQLQLVARRPIYAGTLVEYEANAEGAFHATSMLNYMAKDNYEYVTPANLRQFTFFGVSVFLVTKDILPGELISSESFLALSSFSYA